MAPRSTIFTIFLLLSLTSAREICPAVKTCLNQLDQGKRCPLLPVPPGTFPAPPSPEGFTLKKIRPGVFSYNDQVYFTLILYKNRHLVLVDFPESANSVTQDGNYLLLNATMRVLAGSVPRRMDMVYSHRHIDHIGRAGFVKDFVEKKFPMVKTFIFGTRETVEFLRRPKMSRVPEPNVIVGKSGRIIKIAPTLKLSIKIVGGHTQQDLACHVLPSRDGMGVLHLVDFLTINSAPFLDFGVTIDLEKYLKTQREVLGLNWTVLSPGHRALGRKSDIRRNIRYTEFVLEAAATAGREVPPEALARIDRLLLNPDAVQFGNRGWAFSASFELLVDVCARKTIERWGCILSAVDVYSRSHCRTALVFLNIDSQM